MRFANRLPLPQTVRYKYRYLVGSVFLVFILLSFYAFFKVPNSAIIWRDTFFSEIFTEKYFENQIVILHWTTNWRKHYDVEILDSRKCSQLKTNHKLFHAPCRISYDRRYQEVSDALVFHSFDLVYKDLPEHRDPNQLWVYRQQESPVYTTINLEKYSNIFNWTMTYRRDSDIYYPYGYFIPVANASTNTVQDYRALLTNKTRLAAWIVSHCNAQSKREHFVEELQKFVPVDIYGKCGEKCPSSLWGSCYTHVKNTHKFYLSFENSLCSDYITEKFFNALENDMVPVVYGGLSSQDYAAIAPKNSYIDARDFPTAKNLAGYLMHLDQNDEEYLKYFEWKSKWRVVHSQLGWCNLCQRLYERRNQISTPVGKWYGNLKQWWNYVNNNDTQSIDHNFGNKSEMPSCILPTLIWLF